MSHRRAGLVMRICSFLPSATEMLFALGLGDQVVAVSHECDYPPEAQTRPRVTTLLIGPAGMSSAAIDAAVSAALAGVRPSYSVDIEVLAAARPDLVVTQDLCVVCAIGGPEVRRAATQIDPPPRILSLEPHTVDEILGCLLSIGREVGASERADALVALLRGRVGAVQAATAGARRPRVLCLEWLDPPWVAGHWMPEVVDLAGGADVLGAPGEPSRRATWDEIAEAQPEVAIIMPCGFGVDRALEEIGILEAIPQLQQTPAFRDDRVYVVDASSYYSRSGPRVIDGIELMARMLQPDRFPGELPHDAARRLRRPATDQVRLFSMPIISE